MVGLDKPLFMALATLVHPIAYHEVTNMLVDTRNEEVFRQINTLRGIKT